MVDVAEGPDGDRLYVSYAGADRPWAEWVAWQLQDAGFAVELDAWHWEAGANAVLRMNEAMERGRMVALFSAAYFEPERWTTDEWTAVLAGRDRGRLIPVLVQKATPPLILRSLVAPALFGLREEEARRVLLSAVNGPVPPAVPPGYPGAGGGVEAGRLRRMGATGPRLPGSLPRVWNVPGRNAGFVGRDALLLTVRDRLAGGLAVAVVALDGRGGVGKTQLAAEYAHRFCGEYELVWWVAAEDPALVPDQLARLAVATGAARADAPPETAVQELWAELRTRSRWLLVYDNAEDPAALAPHLPSGPGHVLITSRNPRWHGLASPLDVDVLARRESIALLSSRTPALSPADADRLAEALDDLPLALVQAAEILTATTVDEYLDLLARDASAAVDGGAPIGYPRSLAAQIRLSMDHLRAETPEAADVMRACALLAPEPFPLVVRTASALVGTSSVGRTLRDIGVRSRVLSALNRHGLARVSGGVLHLHRLTQAVIRDQLTDEERTRAAADACVLLGAALPGSTTDPKTWPHWPDLVPHLLAIGPSELVTDAACFAACEVCLYLIDRGGVETALPRLKALHTAWLPGRGPEHPHVWWAANYLGYAHAAVGDHQRGYEVYHDLLAVQRGVLDADDDYVLITATNLASQLSELGRVEEAVELSQDTLARRRRLLGATHRDTLRSAGNLTDDLTTLGRLEEALALGEETLARQRETLGNDHPETLSTASFLSMTLWRLDRGAEARELVEDILERRRRVLGDDHPDTGHSARWLEHLAASEGPPTAAACAPAPPAPGTAAPTPASGTPGSTSRSRRGRRST
ncbi:FxSxx-COOH system tetratricopeptide repeat protein [Streptomyces sp.]|uniref:FxSxx-COOH system tetratricopeptide repeat protein n=1 Tax=Streptomyces sp. TaxID=1931 RepID=UPI002D33E783|nr:FxSxx-COOH system tetratricopeptide repeat protein [Streptomyces sp.]HZF88788.1 FxSxx-COOH system tetratricopeptide repeat protein [Streptomyces sp.]